MKHGYGCKVGLHFRQPYYTRGQTFLQWMASCNFGTSIEPSWSNIHRIGGHESHTSWARITVLGFSLQINLEHQVSNWPAPKAIGDSARIK